MFAICSGCAFLGKREELETPTDEWFIANALQSAEEFIAANSITISRSGVIVMRYTDNIAADVIFLENGGKRGVSVCFGSDSQGNWALVPANAARILDPERWDPDVGVQLPNAVPGPIIDYVRDFVADQVAYHIEIGNNSPLGGVRTYTITEANIVGLTKINTGTAALSSGVDMYLLEYRLTVDHPENAVMAGGMQMQNLNDEYRLTERSSTGQPYLLMAWHENDGDVIWDRVCVTSTDRITQDYGTPEMIKRYGNEYTAAAMELYRQSDAHKSSSLAQ